jgi:glycyl-tRNA synthetase alpha subunit
MGSYPWALYNYGVDNTEHDLRHSADDWEGRIVETYDPLDKTFEEY